MGSGAVQIGCDWTNADSSGSVWHPGSGSCVVCTEREREEQEQLGKSSSELRLEESASLAMEAAPARAEREEGEATPSKAMDGAAKGPGKHPLEHKWTLWFENPQTRGKGGGWGSSLRPIYTFGTVEDFWWYALTDTSRLCFLPLPWTEIPLLVSARGLVLTMVLAAGQALCSGSPAKDAGTAA